MAKKPYEVKKFHGTLNVTRDKPPVMKGTIILSMEPPADLNEWGIGYWNDIFAEVQRFGLITTIDVGAFRAGCKWYGIMCECLHAVDQKGLEIKKFIYNKDGEVVGSEFIENPMLKAAERATKLYLSFCQRFGLTPVDRTRVEVPPLKEEDKYSKYD